MLVEFTDIKHEKPRDELHSLVFVQMNKYWREVSCKQYQDIMVVFAGRGQDSDVNNTNLIWPHTFWAGLNVIYGGRTFDSGGWSSEVVNGGGLAFGAFTHEFGHTIGLRDLYNTDLSS